MGLRIRLYSFLWRPRWIAVTAVMLLLIPAFLELSLWQFHRLDARRHSNLVVSTALLAPATPLDAVFPLNVGVPLDRTLEWRPVTLRGSWVNAPTAYARRHWRGNRVGFYAVNAFRLSSGRIVAIARGWLSPTGLDQSDPTALTSPNTTVEVNGWLRAAESTRCPADLPESQITGLNQNCFMAKGWPRSIESSLWVQANWQATAPEALWASPDAAQRSALDIPPPELSEGPHLSYAWQWRLFALLSVVGWTILVRTERIRLLEGPKALGPEQ